MGTTLMKTQNTFIALALFITAFTFGQNTFPTTGNVGIGTITPTAKLTVKGTISSFEPKVLGPTLNNFQLINEIGTDVKDNWMYNRLWSLRDSGPNNWYGARFHDGISVDVSHATPKLDTKTWWERDPSDNIQSWGNGSDTYFTINQGNIGIGTITPENSEGWNRVLEVKGGNDAKIISSSNTVTTGLFSHSLGFYGSPAGGIIGTTSNHPFSIVTNKTNRLVIANNGNVGIGTTAPSAKLDIFGGNATATNLILSANYKDAYRWRFNTLDRGNGIDLDFTASDNLDAQEQVLKLSRSNSGRPEFQLYNNTIVANDGFVGIGTASPDAKLTVNGDAIFDFASFNHSSVRFGHDGNDRIIADNSPNKIYGGGYWFRVHNESAGVGKYIDVMALNDAGNVGIGTQTPSAKLHVTAPASGTPIDAMIVDVTSFGTGANAIASSYFKVRDVNAGNNIPFVIRGDGNVGIGTTAPDAKLTVNGTIHTKEVRIDLAGAFAVPDYVFAKEYQLKTLNEVDKYVKANNHLPEIPSAKEMTQNGMLVSEMNLSLLKKIEELTLYAIEQQKKLEAQKVAMELLSERLSKLEKK
jgi:Phage T4 tail fibre